MNKQVCLIFIFFLSSIQFAYADFIAFRKLTHPETGNIVYLLYDLHGTIDFAPQSTDSEREKLYNLAETIYKIKPKCSHKTDEYEWSVREDFIKTAEQSFSQIRKNFKNLTRQHNDLIDIVNTYKISLIDEDWPNLPKVKEDLTGLMAAVNTLNQFNNYIDNNTGYVTSKELSYRDNLTPMTGISQALLGKFTVREIAKINDIDAYFYNADSRTVNSNVPNNDKEALEVDRFTLESLDELLTIYQQKRVIIAEGCTHIVAIADELIKKGYQAGELIISDALKKQTESNSIIHAFIDSFKNNTQSDIELSSKEIYHLITDPIDLKAIFEREMKEEKLISKDSINTFARALKTIQ